MGVTRELEPATEAKNPELPKKTFPSTTIDGKAAEAFVKEFAPTIGAELAGQVRLRIIGLRDDSYGKGVSCELLRLDGLRKAASTEDAGDAEGAEDAGDAEEAEKALGYRRPASNKQAPELAAEDLED